MKDYGSTILTNDRLLFMDIRGVNVQQEVRGVEEGVFQIAVPVAADPS